MSLYNEFASFEDEEPVHPLFIKILELISDYQSKNENKWPNHLNLTADDAIALCTLNKTDIGNELIKTLVLRGPKEAFGSLFGLNIRWNCSSTGVW